MLDLRSWSVRSLVEKGYDYQAGDYFEETTGLKPGDTVMGTGDAISVLLGPGIIHNIFDGIQRPLEEIAKSSGKYISRGVSVDSLDTAKKWDVHVTVKVGDMVSAGTIIAETQETASILHKSMVQQLERLRLSRQFRTEHIPSLTRL